MPPLRLQYTRSNESLRKHHFFDKFYDVGVHALRLADAAWEYRRSSDP